MMTIMASESQTTRKILFHDSLSERMKIIRIKNDTNYCRVVLGASAVKANTLATIR